ncbi:MAG: aldose 1-epimerase family protein [Acidimicrobiales bacterium]
MGVAPPSGEQYRIAAGGYQATVVQVGAGLRELRWEDRPLVDGYPEDMPCSGGRGQLLIPWPNRVDGGRYRFQGRSQQLALTEPAGSNAIHGLTRWANWTLVAHAQDSVTLRLRLHAQPGWPHVLDLEAAYVVDTHGLEVTVSATNVGAGPAPYGIGAHPYLTTGAERVDACRLTLPTATHLIVDQRGLPTGSEPVAGTRLDFRASREVGDIQMDDTFTDLERDPSGRAWSVLCDAGPDGHTVSLWVDASYRWLQVYTGDHLASTEQRRTAVAIEPMSCPPNALVSGEGLVVLQSGQTAAGRWGIVAGPPV